MSVRFIKSLNALIEFIQTLEFLSLGFVALPSEYSRNFQILSEIYWRIDLSSECIDIKKTMVFPTALKIQLFLLKTLQKYYQLWFQINFQKVQSKV